MKQPEDATVPYNLTDSLQQSEAVNGSGREDCIPIVFRQMEFLPWDNPDNVISEEVETIVRQAKNNLLYVLFLVGGPANLINMAVFYQQGLKDRVNLCMFSLSLADELYLITVLCLQIEQLYLQFTSKVRFGPITIFMVNNNIIALLGFCFASPVLSAIIAVERCLCVFNPLTFQRMLRTRTMAVILVVVIVVVLALFFLTCFRYHFGCVYDPETGVSVTTAIEGEFYLANKDFIDYLDSSVFGVGLPGAVLVVVATTTTMTIVKLRQIVTWRSGTSSTISPREIALTKMLVGNSILFIACIAPIAVIRISWLFFPEVNSGRRKQNLFLAGLWVTDLFTFINATFNFFVYYTMGSRYRETFWALLRRQKHPEKA